MLLIVAGVGYLVDLAIYLALPELDLTVTQYTFVGELLMPLWLLVKGVRRRTLESTRVAGVRTLVPMLS